jgi:hypothetical protein
MRPIVALFLLSAAACSNSIAPRGDIQLTATLSPNRLRRSDTAVVTVVATNRGNETHQITPGNCADAFGIVSADGRTIGPAGGVCVATLVSHTLAPGESFTFAGRWTGALTAGVGLYELRGRVRVGPVDFAESSPVSFRIDP